MAGLARGGGDEIDFDADVDADAEAAAAAGGGAAAGLTEDFLEEEWDPAKHDVSAPLYLQFVFDDKLR